MDKKMLWRAIQLPHFTLKQPFLERFYQMPTIQAKYFVSILKKSINLSTKADFKALLEAYFTVTRAIIFIFQNGV